MAFKNGSLVEKLGGSQSRWGRDPAQNPPEPHKQAMRQGINQGNAGGSCQFWDCDWFQTPQRGARDPRAWRTDLVVRPIGIASSSDISSMMAPSWAASVATGKGSLLYLWLEHLFHEFEARGSCKLYLH